MKTHNTQHGFTLIELLVALGIVAITLGMGVPSFRDMTFNNRMTTQANDYLGTLNLARSEAVKRGSRVTICKIKGTDFTKCDTTGSWNSGWIVFVDDATPSAFAANPTTVTPAAGKILKIHDALGTSTLTGYGNLLNYASYVAMGNMQLASGAPLASDGTDYLKLCPTTGSSNNKGRAITVSGAGRVMIKQVSC